LPSKTIINTAILEATQSTERERMGGVLYHGSSIFRVAHNSKKYIGYRRNIFKFTPTHHVEVSLMHNVPKSKLTNSSIIVVRLSKLDTITNSKPCIGCMKAMIQAKINKCFYFDYEGNLKKLIVKDVDLVTYEKDKIKA